MYATLYLTYLQNIFAFFYIEVQRKSVIRPGNYFVGKVAEFWLELETREGLKNFGESRETGVFGRTKARRGETKSLYC